jgi:hypothetical protein
VKQGQRQNEVSLAFERNVFSHLPQTFMAPSNHLELASESGAAMFAVLHHGRLASGVARRQQWRHASSMQVGFMPWGADARIHGIHVTDTLN